MSASSLHHGVVLLVLLLLILSFWVSYYLKVRRIKSVHETLVALIAGGFVGLVVRLSPGTVVQNMISFSTLISLRGANMTDRESLRKHHPLERATATDHPQFWL
jgi:NhaP-type Na+/H+ or K+/H+ antiporter